MTSTARSRRRRRPRCGAPPGARRGGRARCPHRFLPSGSGLRRAIRRAAQAATPTKPPRARRTRSHRRPRRVPRRRPRRVRRRACLASAGRPRAVARAQRHGRGRRDPRARARAWGLPLCRRRGSASSSRRRRGRFPRGRRSSRRGSPMRPRSVVGRGHERATRRSGAAAAADLRFFAHKPEPANFHFARRRDSSLRLMSPPKPLPSRPPEQQERLDAAVARARVADSGKTRETRAARTRERMWPEETHAWAQLAAHLGDSKAFCVVRALGALTSNAFAHDSRGRIPRWAFVALWKNQVADKSLSNDELALVWELGVMCDRPRGAVTVARDAISPAAFTVFAKVLSAWRDARVAMAAPPGTDATPLRFARRRESRGRRTNASHSAARGRRTAAPVPMSARTPASTSAASSSRSTTSRKQTNSDSDISQGGGFEHLHGASTPGWTIPLRVGSTRHD